MVWIAYLIGILLGIGHMAAMDAPLDNQNEPRMYFSLLPQDLGKYVIALAAGILPVHRDNRRDYIIEQGQEFDKYSTLARETWKTGINEQSFVEEALARYRPPTAEESHFRPNVISATLAMPGSRENHKQRLLKNIAKFSSLNGSDKNSTTVSAIKICPSVDVIKPMIAAGANVNAFDAGSLCSLLHYAVIHNEPSLVTFLLGAGANPNSTDRQDSTPLHYAVHAGSYANAFCLLTHKALPDLWDWNQNAALYYAVKKGDERIVALLLAYGAQMYCYESEEFQKNGVFEKNVLVLAADRRSIPLLRMLLRARSADQQFESTLELMLNAALIRAAQNGCEEIVDFILNYESHITFAKTEKRPNIMPDLIIGDYSALSQALINNHFKIAYKLLAFSTDQYAHMMPHCVASRSNSLKITIEKKAGLDPKLSQYEEQSKQLDDLIDLFLRENTNCFKGVHPSVCLRVAELQQHELLNRILTHAQERDPHAPARVLLQAASFHSAKAVRMLLQFPISPCITDSLGNTPLHKSALLVDSENVSMISDLLSVGADVAAKNNRGEMPLHWVMKNPNKVAQEEVVIKILETLKSQNRSEEINTRDNLGRTALMHASSGEGDSTNIIKLLIANGALVNEKNKKGETALFVAANANSDQNVQILLHYGAHPQITNNSGCGPLSKAARRGNLPMIHILINAGAKLDLFKDAMLREACKDGHLTVMEWLLNQGADINGRSSSFGNTPLHKAAMCKQLAAVLFLLNKGADSAIRNRKGNSPLDEALAIPDHEISSLLKSHLGKK